MFGIFMASLEAEDVSGRTSAEIERVVYARVKNFDFLDRAEGASRQEQWSVKVAKTDENAGSGSIRVRKVTNLREPGAAVQFILTSKLDVGVVGSAAETSEQSTVDQFNVFKYMANKGMLKDRYIFPIPGTDLKWEVDCFPKPGEMYHDWVKIDLEDWPRGKALPQLPMEFIEMMEGTKGEVAPENQEKISKMYQEIFLLPNTNTPLGGDPEPAPTPTTDTGDSSTPPDGGDGSVTGGSPANKPDPVIPEGEGSDGDKGDGAADAGKAEGGKDDGADDTPPEEGKDSEGNPEGGMDSKESFHLYRTSQIDTQAFSSAGQLLTPLIPILGPLVTIIHGQRGADLGFMTTSQHTTKTTSSVDSDGRKTSRMMETGSFKLSDIEDAKDYIQLIETAVREADRSKGKLDRIEMALWPQRDGRFGLINIKTDRNGETSVFTKNNPGKLKWFSMSLAGKRVIKLSEADVARFKFNGRTISCPFNGDVVEFDVGQLRHFKYQTIPKNNAFDIVEFNFDA